jgi:lysine/ornithine N-monooxygenase
MLAFQLGANLENRRTVAVRSTKMVQQQTTSCDKLFNHVSQQQRGLSNAGLALLLARQNQIFDHVWAPFDGQMRAHAIVQPLGGTDHL